MARVDDISDAIRRMVHDPESDFGEFVRMQSASSEFSVTLLELLQLPVERLLKYPVYFKVDTETPVPVVHIRPNVFSSANFWIDSSQSCGPSGRVLSPALHRNDDSRPSKCEEPRTGI